jgi:2,3-bisphosphoglycerate-dependent phosphoglycerate mutase
VFITECFLIRHAQSQPDKNTPEPLWPLSVAGVGQARLLKDKLLNAGITKIFSSPYPRAVDTVLPLAKALDLEIETHDDLRERKLTHGMIDNWLEELRKTWDDFDYHLAGGESSSVCQKRVRSCVMGILQKSGGAKIAVSSHGNALALLLNSIDPAFRFEQWQAMGNPHVYKILRDDAGLRWDKQFTA